MAKRMYIQMYIQTFDDYFANMCSSEYMQVVSFPCSSKVFSRSALPHTVVHIFLTT